MAGSMEAVTGSFRFRTFPPGRSAPAMNVMNAPPGVECLEDAHLFVWQPRGPLTEAVLNKILAFITTQEGKFGRQFNRFTDLFLVDAVDLSFKYIFHFALYRR